MNDNRNDIDTRADIEQLVTRFYEKVQTDSLLAPHFKKVDWENHLPVMYSFWSSLMLGEQSYKGSPFLKHVHLPIQREHFSEWLLLFTQTVDELFAGDRAEEIKMRAQSIANIFQYKMGL